MLRIDDKPQLELFLEDEYLKTQPRFSPDNKWIAYNSNKSGRNEIYVRSFPEKDGVWEQISTDGGYSPLWSSNKSKLYYRNGDYVVAATYVIDNGFKVIDSEVLFQDIYFNESPAEDYWDIHPDGDRFLMMKEKAAVSSGEKPQQRINIILNWFEELKKRVPVD